MALRVLLADDQMATRNIVRFNLEQSGFEVLEATDGVDAWNLLQQRPIDLLVTDENMPRLSGIALCEKIRQLPRLAELPVVMITAVAPMPCRETLEKLAIAHCFSKPFSPRELLAKICEILFAKSGVTG